MRKVCEVYLVSSASSDERGVELTFPVSQYEMMDAFEQIHTKSPGDVYWQVDEFYCFDYLAPHLDESMSIFEFNSLTEQLSKLDERQETAMKYKKTLSELKDKRQDEKIELYRQAVENSDYNKLNTVLSGTETDLLLAIMLMHMSYEFKQSLGIEWSTDKDFFKNYGKVITKNRNIIKREFIKQALSEKSVNFAKGMQGILEIFVNDQLPSVKDSITKTLDNKYSKQRDSLKKKIADLKTTSSETKSSKKKEVEDVQDVTSNQ